MKKQYCIPQARSYAFYLEEGILKESSVNKYNSMKDEDAEQYSGKMHSSSSSIWDNMNK